MKCPLCSSAKNQLLFKVGDTHGSSILTGDKFNLLFCRNCQAVFPEISPDKKYYRRYYPKGYYRQPTGIVYGKLLTLYRLVSAKLTRHNLRSFLNKPNLRVLDFGCGRGHFLADLPSNCQKYGLEINPEAVTYLRKNHPEITVFTAVNQIPNSKLKFDLITFWHVLEHLPHPGQTLSQLAKLLSPKGGMIIATPNASGLGFRFGRQFWFHLDTPRHLTIFSPDNLNTIASVNGLRVCRYANFFWEYPFDLFRTFYNRYKIGLKLFDVPLAAFMVCANSFLKIVLLPFPKKAEIITVYLAKK